MASEFVFPRKGELQLGTSDASLKLVARAKGTPYSYSMDLRVDRGGIHMTESTPGLVGYKTLLIPYVRDVGLPDTTKVTWECGAGNVVLRFRLGDEEILFEIDGKADHIIDFPHGFENRRGLCGLIRLDMLEMREVIEYTISVVR